MTAPDTERRFHGIRVASRVVFPTLGGSYVLFAFQVYGQVRAQDAVQIADHMQNVSLVQACLILTSLSILAVCFMARLMFSVMQEQIRGREKQIARAEQVNRELTEALVRQKSDGTGHSPS